MTDEEKLEWLTCAESPSYFIHHYCYVYDATAREWLPFRLWPAQGRTLRTIFDNLLTIILKARQLGMTWLVLGYALWLMLFRPVATVLLFSKRDDEAVQLLDFRMKGMYHRLPEWLQCRSVQTDNDHEWTLSNGSMAFAFPTTAGDSYTATLAIIDEADLAPNLGKLMGSVKPTIDAGGQMILLSRVDKGKPESEFKNIYRAAKQKLNDWASVFLPWFARPERDQAWYEAQRRDILSRTGALDDLHEQYPATDTEALAPRSLDKRIPGIWLEQCYIEVSGDQVSSSSTNYGVRGEGVPAIPGLKLYRLPEKGRFVIGADPAEGNPTSDDSALTVLDRETGEEVAALSGKYQPSTFAGHIDALGTFFNQANVMVERNNHGHAVLLWLRDNSKMKRLKGHDGREGWHSTSLGKTLLYDTAADAFRDGETVLHSFSTYTQLASIEGATLRAPEGQFDDRADGYALALCGRLVAPAKLQTKKNPFYG
jgi:hypothetical protein